VDGSEEVARGLVIACRDGAELLHLCEEILNQVTCRIEVLIEFTWQGSVGARRDHRGLPGSSQRFEDPLVGVEGFVGDQSIGLHRWQEMICAHQIVRLAAGQMEADRVPQGINQGMDLGAQSAARAPDRLVAGFFWAPALC
jgi:hypothetical protein